MNAEQIAREAVRWGAENSIDDKVEIAKKAVMDAIAQCLVIDEDALEMAHRMDEEGANNGCRLSNREFVESYLWAIKSRGVRGEREDRSLDLWAYA